MLVRGCIPGVRMASRSAARREIQKFGPSRGSQVSEIHKRLADYQRISTETTETYAVESLISERLIQNDVNYGSVLKLREETTIAKAEIVENSVEVTPFYPLSSERIGVKAITHIDQQELLNDDTTCDRGFYVAAGEFVDEYVAGSTANIPDGDLIAPDRMYFGGDDAVEHIDFQLPGQRTNEVEELGSAEASSEWTEQFGSADPERAASKHSCGGCGATVHCKDSSLPGFLPVELFDKVDRVKTLKENLLCRRCHLLKNHNFLLNVNVCPVDYAAMMSHLKLKEEALILLVVDVTDLPGSIHRHLPNIIGSRKPLIVIGNKVDLLPPDARSGYLKRFRDTVQSAIREAGYREHFNILHTALVSAKTGYGIEELITEVHLKWTNANLGLRNDMYIVGCTNAGKSTLFNAFLGSDLCKVRAVDLVERATTSVWPGTTISLLKFPVMKPSPYRLEIRRKRLQHLHVWQQKEMYSRRQLLHETGDSQYAVLTGVIQNTYKEEEENLQPVAIKNIVSGEGETEKSKSWNANDPLFAKGTWCFDTPGTVCEHQIVSLFTLDELVKVLPRRLLVPRTALIPVGHSLLIGGVGQVDIVETSREHAVYLTTFASDDLPLNIVKTEDVDAFFLKYLGTDALVVPSGKDRLKDWPGLASEKIFVKGYKKFEKATADIVLSSVGWISVTTPDHHVKLNAWSIAGKGLAVREPILPFSASLRGRRIPGTYFYKVKPVEFPENCRRKQKDKKYRK